jgi:hypothetical protein
VHFFIILNATVDAEPSTLKKLLRSKAHELIQIRKSRQRYYAGTHSPHYFFEISGIKKGTSFDVPLSIKPQLVRR